MLDSTLAVEFWQWLDKLGRWYFCPDNEGHQVRLHWPHDDEFDGKENRFVEVVSKWNPSNNIINTALELEEFWDASNGAFLDRYHPTGFIPGNTCEYPPYIPYLVCFSMAWGEEGDYSSQAYYNRLNDLLNLSPEDRIHTNKFRHVDNLWKRLEKWANTMKEGELGSFSAASVGSMIHVGYPLSQVVLGPADRSKLHDIFVREGLVSEIALEDSEIRELLSEYKDRFNKRVQTAINTNTGTFLEALYEEIRIELESFSPVLGGFGGHRGGSSSGGFGGFGGGLGGGCSNRLRLACKAGLHGIEYWKFVTFQEVTDFQEIRQKPFIIRPGQSEGILWQRTPQMDTPDPMQFDDFSFLGQQEFCVSEGRKRFRWPSRNIRFLVPSNQGDGLLLEQDFLPETGPVSILISSSETERIEKIAKQELCGNILKGCKLFLTDDIKTLNELFQERHARTRHANPINLTGGVKLFRDDTYFSYALPQLSAAPGWTLEPGTPSTTLGEVAGKETKAIKITGSTFPEEITVRTHNNSRRLKTKKIKVSVHPDIIPPSGEEYIFSDQLWFKEETALVDGDWHYHAWPLNLNDQTLELWKNPALQAWEVLSTWGHCSYVKFSNTIHELFREQAKPSWVARDLQFLGHINIGCSSSNGYWNSVWMLKGHLCRLPWNMVMEKNEFVQAVLLGQVHLGHLLNTVNNLPEHVKFDICEQPYSLAPPRIRFWANNEQNLIELAKQLEVGWQDWPAKFNVTSIKDAKNYLEEQDWIDGLMSPGESMKFFSPYHLKDFQCCTHRVERLHKTAGQFLLATQEQTYHALEFYLLKAKEKCRLKLNAGHRQWGRWLSYTSTAEEFYKNLFRSRREYDREVSIAIPYDQEKGVLAFPAALVPPMPVARILCRCSGMLPSYAKWHDLSPAIKGLKTDGIDAFDSPFFFPTKGSAIVYRKIPYPVAVIIGSKLGIEIKNTALRNVEKVL